MATPCPPTPPTNANVRGSPEGHVFAPRLVHHVLVMMVDVRDVPCLSEFSVSVLRPPPPQLAPALRLALLVDRPAVLR